MYTASGARAIGSAFLCEVTSEEPKGAPRITIRRTPRIRHRYGGEVYWHPHLAVLLTGNTALFCGARGPFVRDSYDLRNAVRLVGAGIALRQRTAKSRRPMPTLRTANNCRYRYGPEGFGKRLIAVLLFTVVAHKQKKTPTRSNSNDRVSVPCLSRSGDPMSRAHYQAKLMHAGVAVRGKAAENEWSLLGTAEMTTKRYGSGGLTVSGG
ncbi:hypothetical protein EDB87DRAFT_1822194 [Lactarius vividus]|nr:hypothetical protein EDB87DRAFT_1822194 [Lactarius vividus]